MIQHWRSETSIGNLLYAGVGCSFLPSSRCSSAAVSRRGGLLYAHPACAMCRVPQLQSRLPVRAGPGRRTSPSLPREAASPFAQSGPLQHSRLGGQSARLLGNLVLSPCQHLACCLLRPQKRLAMMKQRQLQAALMRVPAWRHMAERTSWQTHRCSLTARAAMQPAHHKEGATLRGAPCRHQLPRTQYRSRRSVVRTAVGGDRGRLIRMPSTHSFQAAVHPRLSRPRLRAASSMLASLSVRILLQAALDLEGLSLRATQRVQGCRAAFLQAGRLLCTAQRSMAGTAAGAPARSPPHHTSASTLTAGHMFIETAPCLMRALTAL